MPSSLVLPVGQSVNETTRAYANYRQQTASLSRPNDASLLYEGDIGRRMRNVVFTTAANAGFERLTCRVLGRGGLDPNEAEAEAMLEAWRFGLLRFNLRNEGVWTGRIVNMEYDYPGTNADGMNLCPMTMEVSGLHSVLTDAPANIPAVYTEEGASSSAAQLVTDGVTAAGWPIRPVFSRVASTGINLGQLRSGQQDTWLDVIVNALTAGGTDGVTYVLLIEQPEDGPKLIAYGVGPADFQVPIRGIGVKRGWSGEEQAYRVRAVYTDGEGSSAISEPASDTRFIQLHNGVSRERVISLSGMNAEAAKSGADAFLAQHGNPVAMTGSPRLVPSMGEPYALVQLAEGQLAPAWRLRAGHIIRLDGFRRFDPDASADTARLFSVETTSYDVEAGVLTFSLDQRGVRSSLSEDPGRVLEIRNAIEPGFAHTGLLHWETDTTTLYNPVPTDTPVTDLNGSFSMPASGTAHFDISVIWDDNITATADIGFYVGIVVDTETWDKLNPAFAKFHLQRNGLNAKNQTQRVKIRRQLPAGVHTFQVWAYADSGDQIINHGEVDLHF